MNKNTLISTFVSVASLFAACSNQRPYDASGTFEAVETVISTDANGKLLQFNVEEGQTLEKGKTIGYIDSVQLYLKKVQLQSQVRATLSQKPDAGSQLAPLQTQLETAKKEQKRLTNLVAANAANQKQLDDISAQVELIQKQIESLQKNLSLTSSSLDAQIKPLQAQIDQIDDQLAKCKIINPVNGTVLSKYAETNELVLMGKPLYKIADLSEIILRAYLTNDQLTQIKLSQKVKVLTDDGKGGSKPCEGIVTWISNKAEFTPKTIQTKDERANLVYAVKINVKNDGLLKIGMYAEVILEK
ncbi:MAG: HlyD family efflux transporter periplasmic adaptor subunit [Bacteroidetes bacterium]|nr:HlyD family efflux transporter periplasmic adaptor subunit [Bacteroidota bacterium]